MKKIKIKVNAKVNLALDIVGIASNGYHELDMVMSSVNIFDIIECKVADTISVFMDGKIAESNNTAYKCAKIVQERLGISLYIDIIKGIPFSAGLGGSSADVAGVLWCVNKLCGVDIEILNQIGCEIGCDVVYMMSGGNARARGLGEIVEKINLPTLNLVIGQKSIGATTAQVYKQYDKNKINYNKITDIIGNFECNKLYNVLQKPAIELCGDIQESINLMQKYTPNAYMTGSGSAVFGIFPTYESACKACENLKGEMAFCVATTTTDCGIRVVND